MPRKVVLVEKDQALTKRIVTALSASGIVAITTADSKTALEGATRNPPDAFIVAAELSPESGYYLCKQIKGVTSLANVPIVIIGDARGFAAHQKLKAHADDYVSKPFEPTELARRVASLLPHEETLTEATEGDEFSFDDVEKDETSQGGDLAAELFGDAEPTPPPKLVAVGPPGSVARSPVPAKPAATDTRLAEAQGEIEALRVQLESSERELEDLRARVDSGATVEQVAQLTARTTELEADKKRLEEQVRSSTLRKDIAEKLRTNLTTALALLNELTLGQAPKR